MISTHRKQATTNGPSRFIYYLPRESTTIKMKIELLVSLCIVCGFFVPQVDSSGRSDIVDLMEPDYKVMSSVAPTYQQLFSPLDMDVPLSQKAVKRVKKSLSKRRMKRLSKPKYLEEKLRDLVEQRPALKSKIKSKLAIQKTRKPIRVLPGGDEISFEDDKVEFYTVPIPELKIYEAPSQFASPALPETPVFVSSALPETVVFAPAEEPVFVSPALPETPVLAAPALPAAPVFVAPAFPETPVFASPALPETPLFPAPALPEVPVFAAPALPETPMFVSSVLPETRVSQSGNAIVLEEPQFGSLEELAPCAATRSFGRRSIYNEIDRDLIAIASNPAFEVHPISEKEILADPCFETEKIVTDILPTENLIDDCQIHTSSVRLIESEPSTLFLTVEDSLEAEPFKIAVTDNQCGPKFKKAIPGKTAEEIFTNCLHSTPDFEFPSEFILESLPYEEHLWAPLEPVKTYEIKQINIDEAAIIQEIKSVLGEDAGPIIIGEPGEPVIVKHFAKPYVIEYYERPVVIDHHQGADINVFRSPPVVVDQYDPVVVNEIDKKPLVVIEEVCPWAEAPTKVVLPATS